MLSGARALVSLLCACRRGLAGSGAGVTVGQDASPAGPLLSAWLPWVPAGPLPGGTVGDPQLCPPGEWLTKLTLAAGSAPLPGGRSASGVTTLQARRPALASTGTNVRPSQGRAEGQS